MQTQKGTIMEKNKTVISKIEIPADAAQKIRLIAAAEGITPHVWITSAVIRAVKSATSKSTMHWVDLREQFDDISECDLDEILNYIFKICIIRRLNKDVHSGKFDDNEQK